ncbi:MAG: hypothetical protein ACREUZ_19295 [Burkholderiales bacterium]
MAPLIIIVATGLLGGLVMALLFIRFQQGPDREFGVVRLEPLSTDAINMARIRVAGAGGLGMVAMAVAVSIFVPRIRLTMAIGVVLGAALAAVLIAQRRRNGPLSSSSQRPGAHSMLSIEPPPAAAANEDNRSSGGRPLQLAGGPVPGQWFRS